MAKARAELEKLPPEELLSLVPKLEEAMKMSRAPEGRLKDLLRRLGCTANLDDPTEYWLHVSAAGRHAGLSEEEVWCHTERELCALLEFKVAEIERARGPRPRMRKRGSKPGQRETDNERAVRRQAKIMPILDQKGWTRGKLATDSAAGKATVYGYFDGSRKTISSKNRDAIADSLGIDRKDLPA